MKDIKLVTVPCDQMIACIKNEDTPKFIEGMKLDSINVGHYTFMLQELLCEDQEYNSPESLDVIIAPIMSVIYTYLGDKQVPFTAEGTKKFIQDVADVLKAKVEAHVNLI